MKKLKKLFSGLKSPKEEEEEVEEYIELSPEEISKTTANIYLKYFILTDFSDIKPILDAIREGYTICMVKIKPLRDKDINELKRAIQKIKKTTEVIEGEVVGIDEDFIIIAPSFVKVFMGEKVEEIK